MKIFKNLLTLIIVFTMLTSMTIPALALSEDVLDTEYEEAARTLGALGIMVGDAGTGNFRPNDTIIRSEAAKIVVHALGLEEMAEAASGSTDFPDVVENHWATGYINIASSHGIVIGDDTGTFRPDDTITFAEIVTMLVRITGHEHTAKQTGGYPNGYIITATQNGISKGVKGQSNLPVTRGMVAQLTFNSLTVKLMEQTGFGDEPIYSVVDKTLLTDKLNVYYGEGIITANENTALTENEAANPGTVIINDNYYKIGNTNAKDLLGYNVTYYYTKNSQGNNETLILVHPKAEQNEVLTVKADNIENVSSDLINSKIILEYRENSGDNETIEVVDIHMDTHAIYNGKAAEITDSDLMIETGEITLIDNNVDGEYDVVLIKSYENYVVNSVNTSNNRITNKYGKSPITLDPKSTEHDFNIVKNGQEIGIKDLKEWNILAVATSKDGKLINIIVTDNKVTGKVSELSEDEVCINGEFYKKAPNYNHTISLNDNGTFYLDIDGKIAAADMTYTTSNSNYGYIIAVDEGSNLNTPASIKLLTHNGNIVNYQAAEKIVLNGINKDNRIAVSELITNGETNKQLIIYELNSENKISKITTAVDATATGYNKNEFSMDTVRPVNEEDYLVYKANSGKLGSSYVVKANTIIFDVSDENNYTVRDKSIFVDNNKYDAVIYDASETLSAGVIVLYSSESTVNPETPIAVVDKITNTVNNDGSTTNILYALENGQLINRPTVNKSVLIKNENVTLQRGDIIQYSINSKGEIDKINVLFDVSSNEQGIVQQGDLTTINGIVANKADETITVNNGNGEIAPYDMYNAIVYRYDSKNNTIANYTTDEIEIEDNVFIKIYKDEVKEIVVIG